MMGTVGCKSHRRRRNRTGCDISESVDITFLAPTVRCLSARYVHPASLGRQRDEIMGTQARLALEMVVLTNFM